MLYKEVTWEEVAELWAKEAAEDSYEEGLRAGEKKGIRLGEKRGREEGLRLGEERGRKSGRAEGIRLGEEKGIRNLICDNLEESVPPERIVEKLIRLFSLDREDARAWVERELSRTD